MVLKGPGYKVDSYAGYELPSNATTMSKIFNLIDTDFPIPTESKETSEMVASNPTVWREILSTIIQDVFERSSLFMRKHLNHRCSNEDLIDFGFDKNPDFAFKSNSGDFRKLDMIEYKSSFTNLSNQAIQELYEAMKEKYTLMVDGSPNKVIVIWHHVNEHTVAKMKAPKIVQDIYLSLYKALKGLQRSNNADLDNLLKIRKVKGDVFELMNKNNLLERGFETMEDLKRKVETLHYKSFDSMVKDTALYVENGVEFLQSHYLPSEVFPEVAFRSFRERESNVDPEFPLHDREHKVKRLIDFPEFKGIVEDASEDEVFAAILSSDVSNPWIDIIKQCIRGNQMNPGLMNQIRDLNRKLATLCSLGTFNNNYHIENRELERRKERIQSLRDSARKKYNVEASEKNLPQISNFGYFKDSSLTELMKRIGVGEKKGGDFSPQTHIGNENLDRLEEILYSIQDKMEIVSTECKLKGVYKNTPIEEYSNLILQESVKHINSTCEDPTFNYLKRSWKWVRQLISMLPAKSGRFCTPDCFNIQSVDNTSRWIFATPSVGENETGALITITCHKEIFDDYSMGMVKATWIEGNGYWIRISNSFRMNRKICLSFQEWVGVYVGLHSFFIAHDINIRDYPLIPSMMWRYNRGLNGCLDRIQLAIKNILNNGTFGGIDMETEFEGLHINDIRTALWMYKTDNDYANLSAEIARKLQNGENLSGNDPASGIPIDRIQLLMSIVYLRQIYPKDDGINELSRYMTFILRDHDQQKSYDESPFRDENINYGMSMEEFYKTMFKGKKWESFRWCPPAMYWGAYQMAIEAMEKFIPDPYEDDSIYLKGKTSKTTVYDHMLDKEKCIDDAKKNNNWGYHSRELNETQKLIAAKFIDMATAEENFKKLKEFGYIPKNLTEDEFRGMDVTWGEQAFYMTLVGSATTVLTLKVKEQKGMDKRLFYIQMYDAQARNSLADRLYYQILRNCDFDFITSRGDEKFRELEEDIERVLSTIAEIFMMTMDQTKYGDMYAIAALIFQTFAVKRAGYFSENMCAFIIDCFEALKKRIILLPKAVYKHYSKWEQAGCPVGETEAEIYKFSKFAMFKKYADLKVIAKEYIERDIEFGKDLKNLEPILANKFYNKVPGFTLGVYNLAGSYGTAVGLFWIYKIYQKYFPNCVIRGEGHSDDSILMIDLIAPSTDLRVIDLNPLFRAIENDEVFYRDGNGFRSENTFLSNDQVAKYFVLLCLTTSSFVGQRSSTKKCGFGRAAEVLQSYYYKGCSIPSWIKFCLTIGATLPNTGPGPDLQSVVGRSYNLVTSNCPYDLQSTILLWSNWIVYYGYGKDIWSLSSAEQNKMLHMPIEAEGIYYHNPYLVEKMGYLANEVRLWVHSGYDKDLKEVLLILQNTDTVFHQKSIEGREAYLDVTEQKGAPSTRKMVVMNLVQGSKTIKSFFEVFKLLINRTISGMIEDMEDILSVLNEQLKMRLKGVFELLLFSKCSKDIKPRTASAIGYVYDRLPNPLKVNYDNPESVIVRELAEIMESFRLMGMKKPYLMEIGFLKRYLTKSFQDSYVKIQPDKKMRNMLGYYNRSLLAPWSEEIIIQEKFEEAKISITEYYRLINVLATREVGTRSNNRFATIYNKLYNGFTQFIYTMRVQIRDITPLDEDQDLIKKWVTNKTKLATGLFSYNSSQFCAIVLQFCMTGGDRQKFYEMPAVKYNFKLKYNPNLLDDVLEFVSLLREVGMTETNLIQNLELLSKAFDTTFFIETYRTNSSGDNIKFNTLTGRQLDYSSRVPVSQIPVTKDGFEDVSDKYITVASALSVLQFEDEVECEYFLENARIITPTKVVAASNLKKWINQISLNENKVNFNYLLALEMLMHRIGEKKPPKLWLIRRNGDENEQMWGVYTKYTTTDGGKVNDNFNLFLYREDETRISVLSSSYSFDDIKYFYYMSRPFCGNLKHKALFMKKLNTAVGTKWHKQGDSVFMSHSLNKGTYNIRYKGKDTQLTDWYLGLYNDVGSGITFAKMPNGSMEKAVNTKEFILDEFPYKSFITGIPLNSQIVYQTEYVDINVGKSAEIPYKIDIATPYKGIILFWKAVEKKFGIKYLSQQIVGERCSLEAFCNIHWLELIFETKIQKVEDLLYDIYKRNGEDFNSILDRYGANLNSQTQYNIRIVFVVAWMIERIMEVESLVSYDKNLKIKANFKEFMANKRIPVVDWIIRYPDDHFYRTLQKLKPRDYKMTSDFIILYTRIAFPQVEGIIKFMCGYHPMPLINYGVVDKRMVTIIQYIKNKYPDTARIFLAIE